jgi:flagellar L-ring protein precursor FlgH
MTMLDHLLRPLALILLAAAAAPAAQAQRMGSIYDPDQGPAGLIAEKTAYRKGDILTVVISENQLVSNNESSDLARATNLNYKLNVWDVDPDFGPPLPAIDADSSDNFNGSAKYEKSGAFSARLAAVVVDTLPNGNMVVSGRREIRIDNETKLIEFTGIVRRLDIQADNTVQSELVANAEVVYRGSGPMTRSTNRSGPGGLVHDAIAWLWPF